MEIIINGKQASCADKCSITHLLARLALQGKKLAVEVNQEVIPKTEHATFMLSAGDRVEIIQAVGGG